MEEFERESKNLAGGHQKTYYYYACNNIIAGGRDGGHLEILKVKAYYNTLYMSEAIRTKG